jgi:chaperone BCS1
MGLAQSLKQSWSTPANRLDWIIAGITATQWASRTWKERRARDCRDIVLTFSADDAAYFWLSRWLQTLPQSRDLNYFRVYESRTRNNPGGDAGGSPIVLAPDAGVSFTYRGVDCELIKLDKDNQSSRTSIEQMVTVMRNPALQLKLKTSVIAVAHALLAEIATVAQKKQPAAIFVKEGCWGWTQTGEISKTRAAILPTGQLDAILKDVSSFLNAEKWYQSVGLPYRRGYLLHGTPGSGKTSLVLRTAAEFDLNVYVLPLQDQTDSSLAESIRGVQPKSLVLFEDIDCAWEKRESKNKSSKLTFSGLLNAIDGAATPEGRIAFLTTNHKNKLDKALIRPGRVDYQLEFGNATRDQIVEMASRFSPFNTVDAAAWANENLSMAQVQERLKKLYTPQV